MKESEPNTFSFSSHADLGEKVISLVRYYGEGKRSAFATQVFRKADDPENVENWIEKGAVWHIYNRLCDFGLISQKGQLTDVSWQWGGDRVTILQSKEAMIPKATARLTQFKSLFADLNLRECEVFESGRRGGNRFALTYVVTDQADTVLSRLRQLQLPIEATFNTSFLQYLPSAQDVFRRLARRIDSAPSDDELERRECFNDRWLPIEAPPRDKTFLLRKPRIDGRGYQFWLVTDAGKMSFEIRGTDWMPLLMWWVGNRRWPVRYIKATQSIVLPAKLFYALPTLVRQALISPRMRWPSFAADSERESLRIDDFSLSDLNSLAHFYEPAIEVKYAA